MLEFLIRLILKIIFSVYPLLYRVTIHNLPKDAYRSPYLYAHYHGDELALVPSQKNRGITTLSSLSRDGQRMSSLLKFLGYHVITGSSSRRSVGALIELKNYIAQHPGPISFAVDGPRGPRHEIKPGVVWLSQKLSTPIIFISVICPYRWTFHKSWNQTYIPKPFSHVHIYCSNPIHPPKDSEPQIVAGQLTSWMKTFCQDPTLYILKPI